MGNTSIGNLSAILTADASQLVSEIQRAAGVVDAGGQTIANSMRQIQSDASTAGSGMASMGLTGNIAMTGLENQAMKFALGLGGAMTVARLASREVKNVIANIDDIPGVPQATLDSILQMKYEFEATGGTIKVAIADAVGWFASVGRGLGYAAGALSTGDLGAVGDAMKKMHDDAIAWDDLKFDKSIADLVDKFNALRDTGKQGVFTEYLKEAAVLNNFLATGSIDLTEYSNAYLGAMQKQAELEGGTSIQTKRDAQKKFLQDMISYYQHYDSELDKYNTAMQAALTAEDKFQAKADRTDPRTRLNQLLARISAIKMELSLTNVETGQSVVTMDQQIKDLRELPGLYSQAGAAMSKLKDPLIQMDKAFEDAFNKAGDAISTFIVTGKFDLQNFLQDVSQQIVSTFIKLSVINPMIQEIFGASDNSTWSLPVLKLGGMFAGGGDPPVGMPSLVGENGPELFVPRTSGTIIPNGKMGGVGGGSSPTYFIDARGADAARVAQLEQRLVAMNASVESRSVAAVVQAKRRGGTLSAMLARS